MVKTGTLRIDHNTRVSRLDSGPGDRKRLAKDGEGDPFGNATDFLVDERSLDDGDFIFVVGTDGSASGVEAIFITDAGLASEATRVLTLRTEAGAKRSTTKKKSGTGKTKKKAGAGKTKPKKKAGTKKTAKKGSGRKSK